MQMDLLHLSAIAGILCLASAIQSAVGFAFALFATPLLLWMGIPLTNVIALVATCAFFQALLGARRLRASVPWRLTLTVTAVRLITLLLGLFLLKKMTGLDTGLVKAVVGGVLILLVGLQMTGRGAPLRPVHWGWGGLAFSVSGLLSGICGMGGPPLVLWSLTNNWSVDRARGFLFSAFAALIPIQVVLLYFTFGKSILEATGVALLMAPAVLLGSFIGLPIGSRLPREVSRRIVYAILLTIGLSSLLPGIIQ